MPALAVAVAICAVLAALAWLHLLIGHGWFWRTDWRLPPATGADSAPSWPAVAAVVPARDEAAMLGRTLPSLLTQDYPGALSVVVVDDESTDGTADIAQALGRRGGREVTTVPAGPRPEGWVGKVWALSRGVTRAEAAAAPDYFLFTDADIAHAPGSVTALVSAAERDDRDLVSSMALLNSGSVWECAIVPAFVYFFAMLYPFRRASRPSSRVAAAAGGCVLVRRAALARAGGLEQIAHALIDDVALGTLVKSRGGSRRIWLGFSTDVVSMRVYPRLSDLWTMVARSAFTQLRYSWWLLAGTVAGLALLFGGPVLGVAAGAAGVATGGGGWWWVALVGGGVAWSAMTVSNVPVQRLYGLSPLRALALPFIAVLYTAMTVDSAWRHARGRGGAWKGRTNTGEVRRAGSAAPRRPA